MRKNVQNCNQKKCSLNTEIDQGGKQVDRRMSFGRSRLILHWMDKIPILTRTFFNQYSRKVHKNYPSIASKKNWKWLLICLYWHNSNDKVSLSFKLHGMHSVTVMRYGNYANGFRFESHLANFRFFFFTFFRLRRY